MWHKSSYIVSIKQTFTLGDYIMNANFHAADPKLIKAILEQLNWTAGATPLANPTTENEIIITAYEDDFNKDIKDQYSFRVLKTNRKNWESHGCDIEYSQCLWVKLTKTGKVKANSLRRSR
jgi:hypothetical protein